MRIANSLKLGILLANLGWAGIYKGLIVLAVFIFLGVGQWSNLLKFLLCLLYILAYQYQVPLLLLAGGI